MFTGIVEEAGTVVSLETTPKGCRYVVEAPLCSAGAQLGESIAHNGCCLTVAAIAGPRLTFDLLEETRRATNLLGLKPGSRVNLERSLRADARLGGHFVTGHVDGTATVLRWEREGSDYVLEVEVPAGAGRYLVPKGCIAIDGISLTVGKVDGPRFNVWIIPHTYQVTTLQDRKPGDAVNVEFDLLAKYAEKLLAARG
ncbi:MAG: riboflavin synthase [Candidatus Methylacidiphilales bacterium]|nr:riboflavin synthase [Candidatus Methylacidiphilales bacterium]